MPPSSPVGSRGSSAGSGHTVQEFELTGIRGPSATGLLNNGGCETENVRFRMPETWEPGRNAEKGRRAPAF